MTSIAFIIDFITYFSVFCFVFHLKLKKSVLHISLGCAWAVLGSCFLYLYSPDFSYRIIILFGLYLLFQAKLDHVFSVLFPLHTDLLPGRMLWAIFLFAFDRHKCFRQSFDLIPLPYFCFPVLFTALHPVLPRHSDHFSLFPALCEKQPVHFRPLFSTSGSDGNTKRLF